MGAPFVLHDGLRREAAGNGFGDSLVGREVGGNRIGKVQGAHRDDSLVVEAVRMRHRIRFSESPRICMGYVEIDTECADRSLPS